MTDQSKNNKRIIVIGASSGGFKAIAQLLGEFKGREDAVFVVVLHTSSDAPPVLAEHLGRLIAMPVSYAENDMEIKGARCF